MNIYHLIGKEHPKYLETPIKRMKMVKPMREPVYLIKPIIDGEVSNYYEWISAGMYSVDQVRGAMHQKDMLIKSIYYGFSLDTLYLRLDTAIDLKGCDKQAFKGITFETQILAPQHFRVQVECGSDKIKKIKLLKLEPNGNYEKVKTTGSVAVNKIIELGVPFADLEIAPGAEVHLTVSVKKDGKDIENWPKGGVIIFRAPDDEYIASSWFV